MRLCSQYPPLHLAPLFGYCDHQAQKLMGRRLRQYDVSPMQCRTMTFLHDCGQPVNQKALERHLMVKPSTVNGIVDRLEEKSLVQRTVSPRDGRCRLLTLTEAGMQFYDHFTRVVQQVNTQLEAGFTPEEIAQFTEFMLRAARNLSEEEDKQCLENWHPTQKVSE